MHSYIVADSFQLIAPDYVTWCRDNATSGETAEVGLVRFKPPLNKASKITSYSIKIETKNAYMLTKQQLDELPPETIEDVFIASGLEFVSRDISFPIELFKLYVEFPDEYPVNPQPAVYYGREPRGDGLKKPPDSFSFEGNVAKLEIIRPLMYHRYAITWELPTNLP